MGPISYSAVVTYERGSTTTIDFADLDVAVDFARDRVVDPAVTGVSILVGATVVWRSFTPDGHKTDGQEGGGSRT